jgi:hypothetical protein
MLKMYNFWQGRTTIGHSQWGETIIFFPPAAETEVIEGFFLLSANEKQHPATARLSAIQFENRAIIGPTDPYTSVMSMRIPERTGLLFEPFNWIANETTGLWSLGLVDNVSKNPVHTGFLFSFENPTEAVSFVLRWG